MSNNRPALRREHQGRSDEHIPAHAVRAEQLVQSWCIGAGIVAALLFLGNAGIAEHFVGKALSPALGLAALLGFGAHDAATLAAVFVVESVIFGAVVFLVIAAARGLRESLSNH